MSTPHEEPLASDAFADSPAVPAATEPALINPDDPPWGVPAAIFVWLGSIALMIILPLIAIIPYAAYRYAGTDFRQAGGGLLNDPGLLLVTIAATVPAHALTLVIIWGVVTGFGKRPFWQTIGWSFSPGFGWTASVLASFLLLGGGVGVAYLLGVERTPFDEMLESSAATRFAAAFLATATAPLVEELVYRGVLYPALRRALGVAFAIISVGSLFALVHVSQYRTSPGTIAAIVLLSFSLTAVRAATGRVLPCFVIHLIFNGVQVAGLIYTYFYPTQPAAEAAAVITASARAGVSPFI